MKLYTVQVAPNPTKVCLYIAEKRALGVDVELEQVTVNLIRGEQNQPDHLARNPFGALPVLEIADGDFLTESLPIIDYLEEILPPPSLIGDAPRARARVRELERIADLRVLLPIARYIHATRSPLGLPDAPEIAAQANRLIPIGLGYFDEVLADRRPFVAGECATIADCTLAAALQFARFAALELLAEFPHLRRWDEAYRTRNAAQQVLVK